MNNSVPQGLSSSIFTRNPETIFTWIGFVSSEPFIYSLTSNSIYVTLTRLIIFRFTTHGKASGCLNLANQSNRMASSFVPRVRIGRIGQTTNWKRQISPLTGWIFMFSQVYLKTFWHSLRNSVTVKNLEAIYYNT